MSDRRIFFLSGKDVAEFLQGLVTNDVNRLQEGMVYAAMLTPQGKFLADFFLVPTNAGVFLDVAEALADMLKQRLTMYKLRADVTISDAPVHLHRGLGPVPDDGFADPRHPDMGWRAYRGTEPPHDDIDWAALRVKNAIPETGQELTPDTFILEVGFERLNGVDFRKGCYVGQEVTARMKHKTELRKGLAVVRVSGEATPGDAIEAGGKPAGTLHTRAGDIALAYLRFDRATGSMTAGTAVVERM